MKKFFPLFCTLLVFGYSVSLSQSLRNELSPEQKKLIVAYANQMSIEDGVGQLLMVGIPTDILNYNADRLLSQLIRELHIGNFIVNDYNTYNTNIKGLRNTNNGDNRATIGMLNAMQSMAMQNIYTNGKGQQVSGLPLFIASDFEGTTILEQSPIKHGLTLPPNSLTLSACYDSTLIRQAGKTVGFQLLSTGIHAILGPVLDIATKFNITMQNRVFGSTSEIVYKRASYFIAGLQEAGIVVVGKHYPSHNIMSNERKEGDVTFSGSPESRRMYYNGGVGDFRKEPLGYPGFNKILDGVLTSHLVLGFMQHGDDDEPVTVSHTAVEELLRSSHAVTIKSLSDVDDTISGLGFTDQVLMTDDLSKMGAIRDFMRSTNKSFEDIAIQAFNAGHDILLFAHLQTPTQKGRSPFSIDNLTQVRNALVRHIQSNSSARKHFRESLTRILMLKAKINNKIGDGSKEFPSTIKQWSVAYDFKPTKLPANVDSNFKQPQDVYQAIYDKALVCLNKKAEYNFSILPQSTPILFAVDFRVRNKFEAAFKDKYPRAEFYDIPIQDVKGKREEILATLKRILPNVQYVVLTVITRQHRDILASLMQNDDVHDKLIVFFHNNPCLLDVGSDNDEIQKQRVTLLGNFDYNSHAFDSDIKVLQGTINPRPITTGGVGILPVSIAGLYDVSEYIESWKAAEGFAPIPFYNTDREKLLSSNVMRLSDSINVLNRRITAVSSIRFVGLWLGVVLLVIPLSWLGKKMVMVYKDSTAEGLIEKESKWYKSIFVVIWTKKEHTWKYSLLILLCLLILTGVLYLIDPRIPNSIGKWIIHLVRKTLDIPSDVVA